MPEPSVLLDDLIAAVSIRPPLSFSWFGRGSGAVPRPLRARLTEAQLIADLAERLTGTLYANFYCPGTATRASATPSRHRADPSFVAALSRANRGTGCADRAWRVEPANGIGPVFRKDGLAFRVAGLESRAGARGALVLPKELLKLAPGFYTALANRPLPARAKIVRVYWNLEPAGAPRFVAAATRLLNAAAVPFRLKVRDDPTAYERCDPVVLYLPSREAARIWPLLEPIHRDIARSLRAATSPFTKRIAAGVSIAEDPGNGESFGMDRCRIVASALVRAAVAHGEPEAETMAAFRRRGIDPRRPFLEPGGKDRYPVLAS